MSPKNRPPARPDRISKVTLRRVAVGFLILAALDVILGQKILGIVFAVLGIALSLGAGYLGRPPSTSRKGR